MKIGRIVAAIVVLLAAWGAYYMLTHREKSYADSAQQEAKAQASETEKCKARLAYIYKAWADYKRDHKGAEPSSATALIPKYIKDPNDLLCPTADRWLKMGKGIQSGEIEIDRRKYRMTYGFMWTGASAAFLIRKFKEKAPLVICTAHEEAMYQAGYKRQMPLGSFSTENRPKLISEVAAARALSVLRNGKVEERDPAVED